MPVAFGALLRWLCGVCQIAEGRGGGQLDVCYTSADIFYMGSPANI